MLLDIVISLRSHESDQVVWRDSSNDIGISNAEVKNAGCGLVGVGYILTSTKRIGLGRVALPHAEAVGSTVGDSDLRSLDVIEQSCAKKDNKLVQLDRFSSGASEVKT